MWKAINLKCQYCRYTWIAVYHIGTKSLECPKCHLKTCVLNK